MLRLKGSSLEFLFSKEDVSARPAKVVRSELQTLPDSSLIHVPADTKKFNDQESGMIIFSCGTNLESVCTKTQEVFIDGTFKCCPKFFRQRYTNSSTSCHWYSLCFQENQNLYIDLSWMP